MVVSSCVRRDRPDRGLQPTGGRGRAPTPGGHRRCQPGHTGDGHVPTASRPRRSRRRGEGGGHDRLPPRLNRRSHTGLEGRAPGRPGARRGDGRRSAGSGRRRCPVLGRRPPPPIPFPCQDGERPSPGRDQHDPWRGLAHPCLRPRSGRRGQRRRNRPTAGGAAPPAGCSRRALPARAGLGRRLYPRGGLQRMRHHRATPHADGTATGRRRAAPSVGGEAPRPRRPAPPAAGAPRYPQLKTSTSVPRSALRVRFPSASRSVDATAHACRPTWTSV